MKIKSGLAFSLIMGVCSVFWSGTSEAEEETIYEMGCEGAQRAYDSVIGYEDGYTVFVVYGDDGDFFFAKTQCEL